MKTPWTVVKDWWLRQPQKQIIVQVMRADEMMMAHPDTDYTHCCHRCGEMVGVYPSTVKLMKQELNVVLICNHCSPESMKYSPLVPGAETEVTISRPRDLS